MKKFVVFILVILALTSSLFASNVHFVFGDLGQHPDILIGFIPSYLLAGVGIKPTHPFIQGNTTDFQILVGEGYNQRLLWQDKDTGANLFDSQIWNKDNALKFNIWQNDLSLRFLQGFLSSPVEGKDLLTASFIINAKYERYYDKGKFLFMDIKGTMDDTIGDNYGGNVYPELSGERKDFFGLEMILSLKMDMISDNLHTNDGDVAKVELKWGPEFLNSAASGKADYISITLNNVYAKTLWEYKKGDKSMVSFTLVDRANFNWTGGKSVPSFIQGGVSLGRKVRGYNTYTYNTEFTLVNNFDLRIAGPGLFLESIAPRVNIFFDCGLGWGRVFQGGREEVNFLASTGVQFTVSFFDFIDLGYELNFLLTDKKKYTQPDTMGGRFTTNVTFFLDF